MMIIIIYYFYPAVDRNFRGGGSTGHVVIVCMGQIKKVSLKPVFEDCY